MRENMPGFTTHYLFGEYIYKKILPDTPRLKRIIKKYRNIYNLGLEGPDVFFYYLPSILEWGINLGSVLHERRTGEFFENFISYIRNIEKTKEKEILYSYLAGFLGHYLLDCNCHPYIYDITQYNPLKKPPIEYHGRHMSLERNMDTLLLKRWKKTVPSVFRNYRAIKITKKEQDILTELLAFIIPKTYHKKLKRFTIKKSITTFYMGSKWLCDKNGKKKRRTEKIEKKIFGFSFLSSIITADEVENREDIFNLSHKEWSNPWDRKKKSRDSFFELMKTAAKEYKEIIGILEKAIRREETFGEIKKRIGNRSYHSGFEV